MMADRKVSELNAADAGNLHDAALLHVVDLTEALDADKNVKATIAQVRTAILGTTRLWIPASVFSAYLGAPNMVSNVVAAGWNLDPDSDEAVVGSFVVPDGWATYELDLYCVGTGAISGNNARMLVWVDDDGFTDGESLGTPLEGAYSGATITEGGTGVIKVASNILGEVTVTDNLPRAILVRRNANDALDTLTIDFRFMGVLLRGTYG
jgi:hypothetical protein